MIQVINSIPSKINNYSYINIKYLKEKIPQNFFELYMDINYYLNTKNYNLIINFNYSTYKTIISIKNNTELEFKYHIILEYNHEFDDPLYENYRIININ